MFSYLKSKPLLRSILFWFLSAVFTVLCFCHQDKTGPTYPLEGDFQTASGKVHFLFLRSETIGTDLTLMLTEPVPDNVRCFVKYRKYKSDESWSTSDFLPGEFSFKRRGRSEFVEGKGTELPGLSERAGKYEYFVYLIDGKGETFSITGDKAVYARYKAAVPGWVLLIHILTIFASMTIALRTVMEALIDGNFKWLIYASIISLIVGGFIFGPIVQWYAFGVFWSGVPYGHDWTDNKVLIELILWCIALFLNRGERRNRLSVYAAGIMTLLVYFIPHSIFGSEFDYRSGTGHGTKG